MKVDMTKTFPNRTTNHLYPNIRRHSSGGFLSDNWFNMLQVGGGAALALTGVGVPAGVGLMASGGAGMAGNLNKQDPQEPVIDNSWAIHNRNFNMNRRETPYSTSFQTGGRMPMMRPEPQSVQQAPGGQLEQESSNAFRAKGQSHEQGGIQLPGGEIEDDEMLVNSPFTGDTQVHSDELGYADVTKQLSQQKQQLEEQLQQRMQKIQTLEQEQQKIGSEAVSKDKLDRNKSKRESEKIASYVDREQQELINLQHQIFAIDQQIEQLFMQQEQQAAMMGMRDEQGMPTEGQPTEQPVMKWGGLGVDMPDFTPTHGVDLANIGQTSSTSDLGFTDFVPYISNVANTVFNQQLKNIHTPRASKQATPTLDADYNINHQRHAIGSQEAGMKEYASQLNSPQAARQMHQMARSNVLQHTNELYAQKHNIEQQTRGRNQEIAANIDTANIERKYRADVMDFEKKTAGITRDSSNIANLESKLTQRINQDRMLDFQTLQLGINLSAFDGTSIPKEMLSIIGKGGYRNTKQIIEAAELAGVSEADLAKLLEAFNNQ